MTIDSVRREPALFLKACLVSIAGLLFLTLMRAHSAFPGSNPAHPKGWYGWFDQGQYLVQLDALFTAGRSSVFDGVYPPGFMVGVFPLAAAMRVLGIGSNESAMTYGNLGIVLAALALIVARLRAAQAGAFLLGLCALAVQGEFFSTAFVVPWSSSITLLCTAFLFWIWADVREVQPTPTVVPFGFGLCLAVLLHTRPQDFGILGAVFAATQARRWLPRPSGPGSLAVWLLVSSATSCSGAGSAGQCA